MKKGFSTFKEPQDKKLNKENPKLLAVAKSKSLAQHHDEVSDEEEEEAQPDPLNETK